MTRVVFIDTETTSLRPDRRAWDVALIVRDPGQADVEHQWFVDLADLDLGNADPYSLTIGRFHERHPQSGRDMYGCGDEWAPEPDVLSEVEQLTRGAHIVGAVPSFDTEVLAARMRANGICPDWHYHLADVENLAAGWLHCQAALLEGHETTQGAAARLRAIASPPWNSSELSRAVGVEVDEAARHTALGDARWARNIYDAVIGSASPSRMAEP